MTARCFGTFQKNLETLLSTLVISVWWKKTVRYIKEMPLSDWHTLWKLLMFWQCLDIYLWHVLSSTQKAYYNFVDLDKLNIDYCRCFIFCRLLVCYFEDVVSQSDICSSGSLRGVLVRSHCSQAWAIHSSAFCDSSI